MTLALSFDDWRKLFPDAPDAIVQAFTDNAEVLAEITASRNRLAYAAANVGHECAGYTLKGLVENINYSAKRMAEVWPNRFDSAAAVQRAYGTAPGWQLAAFDDIYGNRMGNRPGTRDGSLYIGRGGPQITGRDGYAECGKRCGLDLVGNPELATLPEHQPALLAAFWNWKRLSRYADAGDFLGCVKAWNGGTNGLKDRKRRLAALMPVVAELEFAESATV